MCYNLTKYPTVAQLFQIFFKTPLSEESWNITDSPTMQPNVIASKKQMKVVPSALSELSVLASQTAKLVTADERVGPKATGVSQELCKNADTYFSSGTKDPCRNCVFDAGKIESKFKCHQQRINLTILFRDVV